MSYSEVMNVEAEVDVDLDPLLEDLRTNDLTVADRCDTCGAQAYVVASLKTGDLMLCSHHYNKGKVRLQELNAVIKDETYKLHELPSRLQGED